MEPGDFRKAMRHCAGAVALVTVGREDGRRTGLTATAVCSLSDDPPSLLVCVNRNASAHPRIREERCFGVSFLGEEHVPLALTFSGQKGVEGDEVRTIGRHKVALRHVDYVWEHDEIRKVEKCIPAHYKEVTVERCIPAHEECREVVKCIPGHFETVCERVFIEGCLKKRMVKKCIGGHYVLKLVRR